MDSVFLYNSKYKHIIDSFDEKEIWYSSDLIFFHNKSSRGEKWYVCDNKNKQCSSKYKTDISGNIWLVSDKRFFVNGGLEMYDGQKWNLFQKGTNFAGICFDQNGNLYASTMPQVEEPGIILKYDYEKWDTLLICSRNARWVSSMCFDKDNNMWLGVLSRRDVAPESGDGVYKFDGQYVTRHFHMLNSKLPGNSIGKIVIDGNENIWIASLSSGLSKLSPDMKWTIFDNNNTPMKNESFWDLAIDSKSNIWFSTDLELVNFKE